VNSRLATSLRGCLLLIAFAPVLAAQGQNPPSKGKGRLILPSGKPAKGAQEPVAESNAAATKESWWGEPANRYEEVFAEFEAIENPTAAQRKVYFESLSSFGLKVRATALKALDSPHPQAVVLAADLLEFVGDAATDLDALIEGASGVGNSEAAVACLETAFRLNGGWLPARAVALLDHPMGNLRNAVESRLARRAHESYVRPLLQRLRFGRDIDTRTRAAKLLTAFNAEEEVQLALREALSDRSVPLAFAAVDALIGDGTREQMERIQELLDEADPGPEYAYALYGLLRHQEQMGALLIDEAMLPRLQIALRDADPFLSAAGAAALAEYHFRATRDDGLEPLERDIVYALVRAVGGVNFYPQYARFSPLAEASLQRFSGEDFSDRDRSAWLQWLADNHDGFRAVRGELRIEDEDLPALRVAWETADGRVALLAGTAADSVGAKAPVRWLGKAGLERLVDLLDAAHLLDTQILPGTYGPSTEGVAVRLEIEAAGRRKRLTFRGPSGATWLPGVLRDLEALHDETDWQLLAAPGAEREFALAHLDSWDAADAPARAELHVRTSLGRLADPGDAALAEWARVVATAPGLELRWDPALAGEFFTQLRVRALSEDLARPVLDAALRVPDIGLADALVEALQDRNEPLRSALLLDGLARLGPEACARSLSDERLVVRVAAARALGRTGTEGRSALLRALDDANPLVVKMAVRSLGELDDPSVAPQLLPLARQTGQREVRKEALWALGRLQADGALDAVLDAALDADSSVRIAAVTALGRLNDPGVRQAFGALFPAYAGTPLEVTFMRALGERGAGFARSVIRPHLAALDVVVASSAAIQCGRLGDPTAAPFLIGMLPDAPRDPDLLDALTFCLCTDFRSLPDPAGVYGYWWSENGAAESWNWLAHSAEVTENALPTNFGVVVTEGAASRDESVASLLGLLENGPSHLRAVASYYLHRLTGVDAPAVHGGTPQPVVSDVARAWHAWLADRAKG